MKRKLLRASALLLLLCMLLSLTSCFLRREDGEDGEDGEGEEVLNGGVEDKYGIPRPELCWLSECMLLSTQPSLTAPFGTQGEAGLAGESLLQCGLAGDSPVEECNAVLQANRECYLVCLYYGATPLTQLKITSYLNFTVVSGDRVLQGSDCVGNVRILESIGDLAAPQLDMREEPAKRLQFTNPGGGVLQGAILIGFTPIVEGTLVAECYLKTNLELFADSALEGVESNWRVDDSDVACIGAPSGEKDVYVSIDTAYLTEEGYNGGDFSDEDLEYYLRFEEGGSAYLVVDYCIMANRDGIGGQQMEVVIFLPERGVLDMRLERAPTSRTEQIDIQDGVAICCVFETPDSILNTKQGRIIVRLTPIGSGTSDIGILLHGHPQLRVEGYPFGRMEVYSDEVMLDYDLDADFSYYTVALAEGAAPKAVEIPDILYGKTPVTAIPAQGFYACTSLQSVTLGKNIKTIGDSAFAGCTSLSALTFNGTVQEWEAVEKGAGWYENTALTQVVCVDGTVLL